MNQMQIDAIAAADAVLSDAGLPTYTQLVNAGRLLRNVTDLVQAEPTPAFAINPETPPYIG